MNCLSTSLNVRFVGQAEGQDLCYGGLLSSVIPAIRNGSFLFRGLVRFFNLFSMQQDYDKGEAILVFTVG